MQNKSHVTCYRSIFHSLTFFDWSFIQFHTDRHIVILNIPGTVFVAYFGIGFYAGTKSNTVPHLKLIGYRYRNNVTFDLTAIQFNSCWIIFVFLLPHSAGQLASLQPHCKNWTNFRPSSLTLSNFMWREFRVIDINDRVNNKNLIELFNIYSIIFPGTTYLLI